MYKFLGLHFRRWIWLFLPLSFLFRVRIYPKSITTEYFNSFSDKTIIYIIPKMSIMDILILNIALKKLKEKRVFFETNPNKFRKRSLLAVKPRSLFFLNEKKEGILPDMLQLIRHEPKIKTENFLFMPVSVFWSRAAERDEHGFILKSLFPDDGTGNGLQKLFMLLLHRGEVNIFFGKTIELNPPLIEEFKDDNEKRMEIEYDYILKTKRLFQIEFAKERTAAFGPTLYDKDKINQWIISTPASKKIVETSDNPIKTQKQIFRYISEIAANYNYMTLRAIEKMFDFLWNNVFEGVNVRNFESIERYAKDGQIIWMPSHRSHFDYLLLSYVLFKKGLIIPHIAAGINLNFWPIGPILRLGGAFFIRRSFSGNKVYAHTFSEYVNFLLQNSFPLEFFQEGGRSRIGKLLNPKLGMLGICIQSIIKRKAENTYFIPVYFGYDKVMEDDSYAKELRGTKKQKENALQFLNGVRKIFSNYGSVDVSFGEPLRIADIWEEYHEKFIKEFPQDLHLNEIIPKTFQDIPDSQESRDPKIIGFVKHLSERINQKINGAATASSTAILSTVLLAYKSAKIESENLKFHIMLLHFLTNKFGELLKWHVSTNTTDPNAYDYLLDKLALRRDLNHNSTSQENTNECKFFASIESLTNQYLKRGERWLLLQKLQNSDDEHNPIYVKNAEKEFNLWWYRGTIFHVFAAFSATAYVLLHKKDAQNQVAIHTLESYVSLVRHIWNEELYWDKATSSASIVQCCTEIFRQLGIITINLNNYQEGFVVVNKDSTSLQILKFVLEIIRPERDLYGIQAAAAINLLKQKGFFQKDEIVQKSIQIHAKAYTQGLVQQSSLFSKIFANRIFDSYFKCKAFIPNENQKLTLDTALITHLEEFLELKQFEQI